MNTLIIGGSGFIGSEVAKHAISIGHNVSLWDLKPHKELTVQLRDMRNRDTVDAKLSRFDTVMIFAAVTSQLEFENDPIGSFDTNILGLRNVLEACRRSHVRKVMFASSSAVYGDMKKPMREDDPCNPNNMYATSKVMGEYLVNSYSNAGDFKSLIIRFFNTFGVGENDKGAYKSIISNFLDQVSKTSKVIVYGDGRQKRDFIHVRDAARITYELAARQTGTFNVGTGRSTSWNQILTHMRARNLKFEEEFVPNHIAQYQYFTQADTEKITALGLRPRVRIEEGIDELISHYNGRHLEISPD